MNHNPKRNHPPFPKGVAQNPGGMLKQSPEEKAAKKLIKQSLYEVALMTVGEAEKAYKKNPTFAVMVACKLFTRAGVHGNVPAIREVYDRTLGKVPQAITGEGGSPLIPVSPDDPTGGVNPSLLEKILKAVREATNAPPGKPS